MQVDLEAEVAELEDEGDEGRERHMSRGDAREKYATFIAFSYFTYA